MILGRIKGIGGDVVLKEDGEMYCDSCEEMIEDGDKAIFIDAAGDGGEFCCWGCVVEWASEFIEDG